MNIPIEIIVGILGFLFSIMTIIVGFLFKILGANTAAIESINVTLAKIETSSKYEEKECLEVHGYIKKKLIEHSSKIEAHGIVLVEHEIKLKELIK